MYRLFLFFFVIALALPLQAQQDSIAPQCKRLRSIFIEGNKVTKDHIILRELTFHKGDSLCADELAKIIQKSEQNIFNTSLFNFVKIKVMKYDVVNPADSLTMDLLISVSERWYTWPSPIFEVQEPNFNTWWQNRNFDRANYGLWLYRQNFRGRNEQLILNAQLGYTHRYALKYGVPYLTKKQRLGAAVTIQFKENAEVIYGTTNNQRDFFSQENDGNIREEFSTKLQFFLRPSYYTTHTFESRFNYAMVTDSVVDLKPDYFARGTNSTRFLSLIYSITHDKRNIRYYPTKGYYLKGTLEKNGLGVIDRNGLNIVHAIGAVKKYGQISKRIFWGAGLEGKALLTPSIPYYHQEGLGYGGLVRGYELYIIDGQHWFTAKSNIKYRIFEPREINLKFLPLEKFNRIPYSIYLNGLFDVGRVWDKNYFEGNPLSNEWLYGIGLGLDFVTYYDKVLRLEYTFNGSNEHGFFIHFTQPI